MSEVKPDLEKMFLKNIDPAFVGGVREIVNKAIEEERKKTAEEIFKEIKNNLDYTPKGGESISGIIGGNELRKIFKKFGVEG